MNDAGVLRARAPQKLKFDERRRCFKGTSPKKFKILDERRRCFLRAEPLKNSNLDERRRCFNGTSLSKLKFLMNDAGVFWGHEHLKN